ncbi:MAG: 3-deoxy-manno-octulosonate cytidylyltransferase [Phycisphaerales bacterium]|nr:3-deoxy-manno-octulosonate cytidylyltransferase [Phycisphaerales bacterium]
MPVVAVIPARLDSTRFPGKVLADETGKPLIQHTYQQACKATSIDRVVIATDSQEIMAAAASFGAEAILTSSDHPNGTSRIAQAAAEIDAEILVNVQADEPEIPPLAIDAAVAALEADPEAHVSTLCSPLSDQSMALDPSVVKVVSDCHGRALYFSRSLIPYDRDGLGQIQPMQHIGLYVYRRAILPVYLNLPATPLEQAEKLEQLRLIEHGLPIAVATYPVQHQGIDTPEQYAQFVSRCTQSPQS